MNPYLLAGALLVLSGPSFAGAGAASGPADSAVAEALRPIRFRVVINAPRPYERMLEEGLDLMRWQSSERVTMPLLERLVADARAAAAEALSAHGYFSPNVRTRIDHSADGAAVVQIDVELGARTHVETVDLDFTGAAPNDPQGRERMEAVRQTWALPPGAPFVDAQWAQAKNEAVARLSRGRYAAAKIAESTAQVVPEKQSAHLRLKLDSGPVFYAGPVHVSGLDRYPPSVVRNLSPHAPGEAYDATKLALYQRRLLETGYFNAVHFTIDPDPDQSAAAPLNVRVIEAPSQRVDAGLVFSTDTGVGLTLDYGNADMFDAAWRLRSALELKQKEQRVNISFDSPPRPGAVWSTYSAQLERSDVQGLLSREAVLAYAHNWGLERVPSQLALSAHFERQSVEGFITDNNHALFLNYRRTFRTTEELVNPREGFIGTIEAGASIPGLATQQFGRVRAHVNWLIPAGLRNDILLRGELGMVLAESRFGIPSSFLFRTGGDQSVRGYAYRALGVPQGAAIVGGRYVVVGSAEYTRWITDTLGAAAFVDAGDAFDDADAFDIALGYGVGARWNSPVGPFRADVAYAERAKRVRLHFSVGYSF